MTSNFLKASVGLAAVLCLAACSDGGSASSGSGEADAADGGEIARINLDPYPSTYEPMASGTTLIQNATIFDGLGGQIDDGEKHQLCCEQKNLC